MTVMRTRWAAIGAAVAVTLGAGGIGLVSATSPSAAVTFVPIEPCRVTDTRPDTNVGPRATALTADEVHTVGAHGDNGECVGIPSTATGVSLNITALRATELTFITVWAAGTTRPNASSLNPAPGEPPTPNAVTTQLSLSGEFSVYNRSGSVDVIVDINGYYTDHDHDDRYDTSQEVDDKIAAASGVFDRTIIVNGGDTDAANGDALIAAVAEAGTNTPTAADPWTVLVEPGTFQLTTDINVPDHVSITGSGIDVTTVTSVTDIPGQSILDFGTGELRDLTVTGADQFHLVESDGSLRVESVKFVLVDGFSALDLEAGPHTVVGAEFFVEAVINGVAITPNDAQLYVRDSRFVSVGGTSVELIYMEGGDVVVDHSTFEGPATGIFSCCQVAGGTLTVRHSLIDVGSRAIVANLQPIDLEVESSTLIGVSTGDVVAVNAPGGSILMRGSTVVGGTGVGGTGAPALACSGTTTATGFLTNACP